MNFLPKWRLTGALPSVNDFESATAIEMVAKVYNAMNGLINEYNEFADQINKDYSEFKKSGWQEIANFKESVEERIRCKFNDLDASLAKIKTDLVTYTNDYLAMVPALPVVSETDNNKFMSVVAGVWQAVSLIDKSLTVSGMAADAAEVGEIRRRVNQLTTLSEGSTTGDAELIDIRVGYNQATYPNAGEAVRGQSAELARFMQQHAYYGPEMIDLSAATFVTKGYIKNSGEIGTNNTLKYTEDFFEIDPSWEALTTFRKITLHTGAEFEMLSATMNSVIFYAADKTSTSLVEPIENGDVWTYMIPSWAIYARFNLAATSPMDAVWIRKYKDGKVGEFEGKFTEAEQRLSTGIPLRKGQKYLIRKENLADYVNAYSHNNSSEFVRFRKHTKELYLTVKHHGEFTLYNQTNQINGNYLGTVKFSVYLAETETSLASKPETIYTVGKNREHDYRSLTACLLDLKDDKTPKKIYINEGDYDIYQEYKDANVPVYTGDDPTFSYYNYCVWIPENTHIIGRGIVRLMWMPDPQKVDLTYNESATVSPVNCSHTMTLENVEIHCKNGRYCIHDDVLGNHAYTNAIKKYINVRCYKYANDDGFGFGQTIGFGVDRSMRYEFHNCIFKNEANGRAFYMHDRAKVGNEDMQESMGSNVVVTNCVMDTNADTCVKLGNSSSLARIRVDFNSCWFSGKIDIRNESSNATETFPNSWDLKLCLCNNVQINVADTANKYPPAVYGYGV